MFAHIKEVRFRSEQFQTPIYLVRSPERYIGRFTLYVFENLLVDLMTGSAQWMGQYDRFPLCIGRSEVTEQAT